MERKNLLPSAWLDIKALAGAFLAGKERTYLIENVSMLIASGMGVLEALDAVRGDLRSKKMRRIVAAMRENIESGSPFWRALKQASIFPTHTISLVRIGEDSGKLAQNLRVISAQQEKERSFQSKIRSAMLYPVFVLSLTLTVGVGIAWFILPKLSLVFGQLRIELPLVTKLLISFGTFLGAYGNIVVPLAVVAMALLVYLIFYFPKTRRVGQSLLFIIPGIKQLIREIELARFGYLLGTLLQAGLPITQALASLAEATVFPHYKKFYAYLTSSVEEGNSFEKSFARFPGMRRLIPTPIQQLIITGEKSGHLPEALIHVSQNYEVKNEVTTKNLMVILEPILLVIVWLGVVAVALAVILPIYSLIGGLQTQ